MRLVTIYDPSAPEHEVQRFRDHFAGFEIEFYLWDELIDLMYHRKLKGRRLFMPSIYHRLTRPGEVYRLMVEGGFSAIHIGNDLNIVGMDPEVVLVESHKFYVTGKGPTTFTITTGIDFYIEKPQAVSIPILLYTHHRYEYFSLTLDALLYSLNYDTSHSPIKILISDPPKEVFERTISKIQSAMLKHPGLDIETLVAGNIYLGSINAMVQYFDFDRFIVLEDDVILPPLTRSRLPNWPLLLSQRLDNGFDVAGFLSETYNRLPDHVWPVYPHLNKQDGWYTGDPDMILPIMGHCVAFKRDFFRTGFSDELNSPTDERLMKRSKRHCSPWLKVYHIGWNQRMHDFGNPTPLLKKDVVDVTSLKTGITKSINLKSL